MFASVVYKVHVWTFFKWFLTNLTHPSIFRILWIPKIIIRKRNCGQKMDIILANKYNFSPDKFVVFVRKTANLAALLWGWSASKTRQGFHVCVDAMACGGGVGFQVGPRGREINDLSGTPLPLTLTTGPAPTCDQYLLALKKSEKRRLKLH